MEETAGVPRRPRLLRVVRGVGACDGIVSCGFLDASLFGVEEKKKVWSAGGQEDSWGEQVPPATTSWLSRQAQQKLRRRHRAGRRKCHCRNLQLQEGAAMTSAPLSQRAATAATTAATMTSQGCSNCCKNRLARAQWARLSTHTRINKEATRHRHVGTSLFSSLSLTTTL